MNRFSKTALLAIGLSVPFLAPSIASAAAPKTCDRDCLIKTLDQYLSAVVKHTPAQAPLAKTFRSTENAREIKAGEGTWKSVSALGQVQRRYADPVSQQVGYFGLVEEAEGPAIVSLRLRVVEQKVTEAEWILGRKAMALYKPEGLVANSPPQEAVAATLKSSREDLIAAADSYFSGIHNGDGSIVKAHPGCYRVENGTWMTGKLRDILKPDGITTPRSLSVGQCTDGFERMGARGGGGGVINRHYFADETVGIGWGTVIFSRPENAQPVNGRINPWLYLTEVFRIENGKIRGIYAAMDYLPPEIKTSGWPEGR